MLQCPCITKARFCPVLILITQPINSQHCHPIPFILPSSPWIQTERKTLSHNLFIQQFHCATRSECIWSWPPRLGQIITCCVVICQWVEADQQSQSDSANPANHDQSLLHLPACNLNGLPQVNIIGKDIVGLSTGRIECLRFVQFHIQGNLHTDNRIKIKRGQWVL